MCKCKRELSFTQADTDTQAATATDRSENVGGDDHREVVAVHLGAVWVVCPNSNVIEEAEDGAQDLNVLGREQCT